LLDMAEREQRWPGFWRKTAPSASILLTAAHSPSR